MHSTRHDLPMPTREIVSQLLGDRLADLLDLKLSIKQAHWNVKGPGFIALHELFDQVATRVDGHADELAERITTLGGVALGRSQVVAARTLLTPYPDALRTGDEHLAAVADRLATAAKSLRQAIDDAGDMGDEVTADLFNAVTGALDKDLWLVEAHLQ